MKRLILSFGTALWMTVGSLYCETVKPVQEPLSEVAVIKEDPRLLVTISLDAKEQNAEKWVEAIAEIVDLPIDLPKDVLDKPVFLVVKNRSLKSVMDGIAHSLRLKWAATKTKIVFETVPMDLKEEIVEAWPKDAREALKHSDEERLLKQFDLAGKIMDQLSPDEWSMLQDGRPVDIDRFRPEIRDIAWDAWLLPTVASQGSTLFDGALFQEGSISVKDVGSSIGLSINASGGGGASIFWVKGVDTPPVPLDEFPIIKPGANRLFSGNR
jgi:hypothetical protein